MRHWKRDASTFFERARVMLRFEEGVRAKPYNDLDGQTVSFPLGFVTIGVGRNLDHNPLDEEEIDFLLERDIVRSIHSARRVVLGFDQLSEVRQLAMLDMSFQLGEKGLARFRKMLGAIQQQDWKTAAAEMEDSRWFRQTPQRAKRKQYMILTNMWPNEYKPAA